MRILALALILITSISFAQSQKIETFQGKRYFICEIDPKLYDVELFNKIDKKHSQYSFATIDSVKKGKVFLIVNGGMYMQDLRPLGLYVSGGKTYMKLKRDTTGHGNFYMQPNGVFMIDSKSKPAIVTTPQYKESSTTNIATQSGPMLVTKGIINSHFTKGSANLNIRNGVGINGKGNIVFVTSEEVVNFYEFAELYRDQLGCKNALYLDGAVSQYYAPGFRDTYQPIPLGVFIVVTKK